MSDRRDHPKARTWSLLLASLALTTDDDLQGFRDRRALDPRLALEKLRRARGLLDAIAQAIESSDASRWGRISSAFELLAADAEISETLETTAPSPGGSAEAAPPASVPPSEPAPRLPVQDALPAGTTATRADPSPPLPALQPPTGARVGSPWIPQGAGAQAMTVAPTAPVEAPAAPRARATVASPTIRAQNVLPFDGAVAAPPPSSFDEPHPDLGGTAQVEALILDDLLPFRSDGPPSSATLTLEQYASFTVERELYPTQVVETRARYGLADASAEAHNDRHWGARAQQDAVTRAELDRARTTYRQWLSTHRPR